MKFSKNFSKKIYWPIVQKIKGEYAEKALNELLKSQWYNQQEVLSKQWELVIRTVNRAAREIPYYRKSYKKIDWNPATSDFTYENFVQLPFVKKENVRDNLSEFLNPYYKGRITSGSTSGSTGKGLRLYYNNEHESYSEAARWRAKSWWNIGIGEPQVTFWGRPYKGYKDRLTQVAKSLFMNTLLISGFDLQEKSLLKIWKKIKKFKPNIIYGYPTAIFTLASYLYKHKIDTGHLKINVVITPGETITNQQRRLIETVFRCKTANEYGCSETGGFVYECPHGNWHISAELTFIEFLDPQGLPVSSGQKGEIYITHLRNRYMPLIRYKVGDMGGPLQGVCNCGRGLPLMKVSVAKESDVFRLSSGKRYSAKIFDYINMAVIKAYPSSVLQFRVIQNDFDTFNVEMILGSDRSGRGEKLFCDLAMKQLGPGVNINTKEVETIDREPSGKLRYFISSAQGY
jgi:phenylacetate-CoA ligase